jgi:ABC-type Fe3+-hydroxamate transport system substrate-binding protein
MNEPTKTVTDQIGRQEIVPQRPSRIIPLVPSQTELLFYLGLDAEIVGLTKFCVHPAGRVRLKQSVGGTKQLRFEVIKSLQPDLIIGNKEENDRDSILRLAESYTVWMSDILTLADALGMIRQVGELVDRVPAASQLAGQIEDSFATLQPLSRPLRVGYFIWQKPYMAAGEDTFIHEMLTRCGFVNAFAGVGNHRYPEVSAGSIRAASLDAILLSSEPFPFQEKHQAVLTAEFPGVSIYLVDGEMFSWYGPRLLQAVPYFREFISTVSGIEPHNQKRCNN